MSEIEQEVIDQERIREVHCEKGIKSLLRYVGEDPDRPGLKETPTRVLKAFKEMTVGYQVDIKSLFKQFDGEKYDEMVLVRDIEFSSLCEHHLLPFVGVAHVAYIPNGPIIGLSKIARVVDVFAKRLQVQERMTQQIATVMYSEIPDVKGSACVIQSHHSCMSCRGVKKSNAIMVTSTLHGSFKNNLSTRSEFFSLIGSK